MDRAEAKEEVISFLGDAKSKKLSGMKAWWGLGDVRMCVGRIDMEV